jgi:hypothetical protein
MNIYQLDGSSHRHAAQTRDFYVFNICIHSQTHIRVTEGQIPQTHEMIDNHRRFEKLEMICERVLVHEFCTSDAILLGRKAIARNP